MFARQSHSPRSALGTLLYVTLTAVLIGGCAGLGESLILMIAGNDVMTARAAVNVAILYALMLGSLGLVAGLLVVVVDALSGWRIQVKRTRALLGSVMAALTVLVIAGGYSNELLLPEMISRQALVADGVILAACVLLCVVLYRFSLRRLEGRGSAGIWKSPMVWACCGLALALGATGVAGSRAGATGPAFRQPRESKELNVLLLVIDALRFDHLGAYGYERETSPNLDALASDGIRFTNAYAQGSRTKETTASIVTSLYASSHRVSNIASVLPACCPTLMSEMKAAGYRTAVFSANPLVSPIFGFDGGVDRFYCNTPIAERLTIVPIILRKPTLRLGRLLAFERRLESLFPMPCHRAPFAGGSADTLNEKLLAWIDEEPGGFFAYVHYMEPHTPYDPPPPFDTLFDPTYEGARVTEPPLAAGVTAAPYGEGSRLPEREFTNLVAQYDGSIAFADQEIDRLVGELRVRGLAQNTLVVITADHGEELYDRGGWSHGHTVHEELVRVPLIVWCPSMLPSGVVVDGITRHVDIMPTVLAAARVESDYLGPSLEGVNLWDFIRGGSGPDSDLPALSEVCRAGSSARSLRIGDLKLIQVLRGSREESQLFDVVVDPGERRDLSVERPEVLQSMRRKLDDMVLASEAKGAMSGTGAVDEETRERLRSLGYVM